MEYLIINNILSGKSKNLEKLGDNFFYILQELAKDISNPLYFRIQDPATTTNILSDLLTPLEKENIKNTAKKTINQETW